MLVSCLALRVPAEQPLADQGPSMVCAYISLNPNPLAPDLSPFLP